MNQMNRAVALKKNIENQSMAAEPSRLNVGRAKAARMAMPGVAIIKARSSPPRKATARSPADLAARLFGNASVRLPALVSQVGELLARLRDRGEVVQLGDDLWIAADEAVVSRTDLPSASVDGHDVPDLTATVPAVSAAEAAIPPMTEPLVTVMTLAI